MNPEYTKPIADVLSIGTVVAALVDMMPHVAAFFSLIWMAIRIYETTTIQCLVKRLKGRNRKL